MSLPIIDISSLRSEATDGTAVGMEIRQACRDFGFFYIKGHEISRDLQQRLENLSARFFAQDLSTKMKIRMAHGGRAWRGYFPVGAELTSGKPDLKEGLYFGEELGPDDDSVRAGMPMHGSNLFPNDNPELRSTVLEYISQITNLGHVLMRGISLSLGLRDSYFSQHFTSNPLILFRIFHYPPSTESQFLNQWGVGEHTDYGLITILKQDSSGGLQVKTKSGWIDAPFIPNTFVCNIGDMLERMTGGYYMSTAHRVRNENNRGRFSFPFFFDPNFDSPLHPINLDHLELSRKVEYTRWDGASVHEFEGTYGDYILEKVSKVFPHLRREVE